MSNKVFYSIVIVVVIAVVGGSVIFSGKDTAKKNKNATTLDVAAVTKNDHVQGPDDAVVTLIEYGDFQCPFCGAIHPTFKEVLPEYKDDVRFVFRHFPLTNIHPNTLIAHRSSEAAANQDKFFEMHDLIYENQQTWSQSKTPLNDMKKYAKQIGLNIDQFESDLNSEKVSERVRADKEPGEEAGVESTPTLFVNGKKTDAPRSADELRQIINTALKTADKTDKNNK